MTHWNLTSTSTSTPRPTRWLTETSPPGRPFVSSGFTRGFAVPYPANPDGTFDVDVIAAFRYGAGKIDNITLSGNVVPEPSALGLCILAGASAILSFWKAWWRSRASQLACDRDSTCRSSSESYRLEIDAAPLKNIDQRAEGLRRHLGRISHGEPKNAFCWNCDAGESFGGHW